MRSPRLAGRLVEKGAVGCGRPLGSGVTGMGAVAALAGGAMGRGSGCGAGVGVAASGVGASGCGWKDGAGGGVGRCGILGAGRGEADEAVLVDNGPPNVCVGDGVVTGASPSTS